MQISNETLINQFMVKFKKKEHTFDFVKKVFRWLS